MIFSIDLRSLAVFRMALGGLLLVDLASRARDLGAHYTDWGVLPRNVLIPHLSDPLPFSVHLVSGSAFGQALIFLIAGVFALALLVGFRTPLVTVVSWLLLLSVQARNPRVLHDSDVLLRLLLFWGMFVPLGGRYSLDSLIGRAGNGESPLPTSVCSVGTAALLIQVCLVYWCTAALKSWEVWWVEGSAVYYALSIDQVVTPFGLWMLGFPDLLVLLSRAVIVLEFLGSCLVFVPFCTPWLRLFVVGAFFCFHLGLILCMSIGLFPYISMVSWLVFVPGLVWERGLSLLPGTVRRRLVAASHAGSAGRACPSLKGVMQEGTHPDPSDHGGDGGGALRSMLRLRSSRLAQALAAVFLVCVVLWNLRGFAVVTPYVRSIFPSSAALVVYLLRLDQSWDMFSPYPPKTDGWFVIPGTLQDGREVELWTGQRGVRWEKPLSIAAQYPNDRWWKFMENIYPVEREREVALAAYAGYVCRDWNARHDGPEQLEIFQVFYMEETTLPDYQYVPPEKKLLGEYACGEHFRTNDES